jgi:hypothetical protein
MDYRPFANLFSNDKGGLLIHVLRRLSTSFNGIGQLRVSVDNVPNIGSINSLSTVSTVSTVNTVSNLQNVVSIGGYLANSDQYYQSKQAVANLRNKIN